MSVAAGIDDLPEKPGNSFSDSVAELIAKALCGGGEEQYDIHLTHPAAATRVAQVLRQAGHLSLPALPAPDEHADLATTEPGESAPVWHLRGVLFDDLGDWVRAASASARMEVAGYDVDPADLDAWEHDLLALLAAVRASRGASGVR